MQVKGRRSFKTRKKISVNRIGNVRKDETYKYTAASCIGRKIIEDDCQ
jgi:hypothetical protein